jgi:hypothetical protein
LDNTCNFFYEVHPWFKDWFNSPYYHQLYFNRDEKEAANFIDKLITICIRLQFVMLDVACGKEDIPFTWQKRF